MSDIAYPTNTGSAADILLNAGTVVLGGFKIEKTKHAHADGLDSFKEQLLVSRERARKDLVAGTAKLL